MPADMLSSARQQTARGRFTGTCLGSMHMKSARPPISASPYGDCPQLFEQIMLMGSTSLFSEIRVWKFLYLIRKAKSAFRGSKGESGSVFQPNPQPWQEVEFDLMGGRRGGDSDATKDVIERQLDVQQPICSVGNMARLILNCEGVGLVMRQLGRDIVMIGRSPLNHIVIDHPTVSAQHAVLLRTGASYSLKDLNSTNGTRVNGDFVTDAELKDGDTVRFGSVAAVFAGAYRKPCLSHAIRKFWMSISSKGAQPIAFATASASLNLV
jgi:FHA domain